MVAVTDRWAAVSCGRMNEQPVPIADRVRRARAGDLDAWSSLVVEFQDVAAGLAAGWSGDWTTAADVAQEAFIVAFLNLERLRDPQAFPAWFKRVVHSATTRHLRREVRYRSSLRADIGAGPDPFEGVAADDEAQQLHRAIESLPEHERAVIALHYLAELPYPTVAETLGISVSAAKKRGFSARRHLQELLPMAVDAFSAVRPSRDPRLRDTVSLFLAIRRRDHELVEKLLARSPQLVDADESWSQEEAMTWGLQNAEGGTPLVRAVQTGDLRLVELVLAAGASPGARCGCAGAETALWAAALFGEAEIAARLLELGTDPNARAFAGVTPLIIAAQRANHEIAELLLAAGADANLTDPGGRKAEDWTAALEPVRTPYASAWVGTGVRAVDLFAPVPRGGAQWWLAAWELGQFALLTEIVRAVGPSDYWQIGFATGPYDAESGRQWLRQFPVATEIRLTEAGNARERRAHFEKTVRAVRRSPGDKVVMILAGPGHRHDVTVAVAQLAEEPSVLTTVVVEPATSGHVHTTSPRPEGFDAQVAFDPPRARRGLWPAIDAPRTTVATYPSARHRRLAEHARTVVEQYSEMDPDLEMPAPAACADAVLAARAQALHRYLAQPFMLWEHRTSLPGESTPASEMLDHIEELLDGDDYRN